MLSATRRIGRRTVSDVSGAPPAVASARWYSPDACGTKLPVKRPPLTDSAAVRPPAAQAARGERSRRLAARLEAGPCRKQQRVAAGRHRLGFEAQVGGIVREDAQGAQEYRQANANHHRVGCTAPAREPREEIAVERARHHAGMAGRIERHPGRPPALARGTEPQRGVPAPERLQLECGRISPIDDVSGGADPHWRNRGLPGTPRMPQRGRRPMHRPGRSERGHAEHHGAKTRETERPDRTGERLRGGHASPGKVVRLGPVGQVEQGRARSRGRMVEQRCQRPVPPRAELFETPSHPSGREPGSRGPGQPRRCRANGRDGAPRQQYPVRCVEPAEPHEPCRGTQQQRTGAEPDRGPAQEGAEPERSRKSLEREVGRRRRHPPYPTA